MSATRTDDYGWVEAAQAEGKFLEGEHVWVHDHGDVYPSEFCRWLVQSGISLGLQFCRAIKPLPPTIGAVLLCLTLSACDSPPKGSADDCRPYVIAALAGQSDALEACANSCFPEKSARNPYEVIKESPYGCLVVLSPEPPCAENDNRPECFIEGKRWAKH